MLRRSQSVATCSRLGKLVCWDAELLLSPVPQAIWARDARPLLCLSSRTHQFPLVLWIRRKAGAMPLKVQRGALPLLWFGKREKITEKFHRPYAALLGTTLALQLLSLSLFSVAMDVERLI